MSKKKFITCDGNYAAAHISYMFSEVSAIYPITPSSNMAEYVDEWAANGRKNIFGKPVKVEEMQSEAGAAGALHGSLQAGALTSTYTASQGLLLMIPNMYKISGELLPAVFHVSARSLAAQALSIFGDHSDIYSTRQTGFAMLATGSVQEIMDIAGVAHLASIKSRIPFMHFFDGFRTSHEIQKVEEMQEADLAKLLDLEALQGFRDRALNPETPVTRGTAQNPDVYFQAREAANPFYDQLPELVEEYLGEVSKITGREYHLFDYYGAEDAENIIIAMGSITETIKEVIDMKVANGEKVGLVAVHLYRPFSIEHFLGAVPKTVKRITVLDRTKEPGANGDPMYLDVRDAYYDEENSPMVIGGRYGLSSKDTTPAQMIAVYENMAKAEPKNQFTVGINDDVTFKSLEVGEEVDVAPEGTFSAKFYGLGADGTVGANKNSIKIIGDSTEKYAQAYFSYDSKKSGGITISHLRFGDTPIRSPYLVNTPNFVACHVPSYLTKYDMLKGLNEGGGFLLNSIWSKEETIKHLPAHVKQYLAANKIKFFIINATKLASEIGLGNRTNTIMQSAFFKIANIIPIEEAVSEMKKAIYKTFSKKGDAIVDMNNAAVDTGLKNVEEIVVDPAWAKLDSTVVLDGVLPGVPDIIKNFVAPINAQKGDDLPVSIFKGMEDGTMPNGTSAYEKRGIAVDIPEWEDDNCIQCNQCSYVCPHACIRPFLLDENDEANKPADMKTLKAIGKNFAGHQYRIQISPLDCTGCGVCVEVCPGKKSNKALVMKPLEEQEVAESTNWTYLHEHVTYKELAPMTNVKNSQFAQPLFEFSGACSGCGETPYIKLITQLFGDRMMIANATGCSSIYGGSCPSTPYTTNPEGKGPAWANSLFEDNAEFGYGMAQGIDSIRERIKTILENNLDSATERANAAYAEWILNMNKADESELASAKLVAILKEENGDVAKELLPLKKYFIKKSVWIFGGDGWAYDIGFGGLDHVIASGKDVNILVMDTEVYSNTGGQSSKATPIGAVAKFAASGKTVRKKDLAKIAMSYGYVYVAHVAMGANQAQFLKAVKEAEAYDGPSIIIAYSPCIAHGVKGGMGNSQARIKDAVASGYWNMFRFNPELEVAGKNPFTMDSKLPDWTKFQDFLGAEVRYTSLKKSFPAEADELFKAAEADAKVRYKSYKKLESYYAPDAE